jgi:hypothetical protein
MPGWLCDSTRPGLRLGCIRSRALAERYFASLGLSTGRGLQLGMGSLPGGQGAALEAGRRVVIILQNGAIPRASVPWTGGTPPSCLL